MRKYISIFNPSHSIVKGNGNFWATLELETEKNND